MLNTTINFMFSTVLEYTNEVTTLSFKFMFDTCHALEMYGHTI
jgi:hypothetical protein